MKYVIEVKGLFEQGYVKLSLFATYGESKIKFQTKRDMLSWCTKFRYKWMADFYCSMANKISDSKYDLRTYTVKEFDEKMTIRSESEFQFCKECQQSKWGCANDKRCKIKTPHVADIAVRLSER